MRHSFLVFLGTSILSTFAAAQPLVIAHRGASGYLPEHTLEAYALAHGLGADYIEADVVLTKDGVFICLHDVTLESTTNVEDVFPERKREDGKWYAIDFTLDEIKGLRCHERMPERFPADWSHFQVPTFEEMIELVQGLNQSRDKEVGIYPELKSPSWHAKQGQPMEEKFLALLDKHGYRTEHAKIFVQCFEPGALEKMRALGSKLPQVFLFSKGNGGKRHLSEDGLKAIAKFADGIGPAKELIVEDPEAVQRAHAAGLVVHPFTLRADQVPGEYAGFEEEMELLFKKIGVDGAFTDFPDEARVFLNGRARD